MSFARARRIADAVLYEGYVLYPYRASSSKNRFRWQFGVLAPRSWSDAGGCERPALRSEFLVETTARTTLSGTLRFLQVQRRTVEEACDSSRAVFRHVDSLHAAGRDWIAWEESIEREIEFDLDLSNGDEQSVLFEVSGGEDQENITEESGALAGRLVRRRWPISGRLDIAVTPAHRLAKIALTVENTTPWADASTPREEVMRACLVGAHLMLSVDEGSFISLLEPPDWAREAAASCTNTGVYPVLAGEEGDRSLMLASPIILYDHPTIAPESPCNFYDSTEIDELLTLRSMTLTDEEKREARATDARSAAILDRVEGMSAAEFGQLHGAVRSLRQVAPADHTPVSLAALKATEAWDPFAPAPLPESVTVGGQRVATGSKVRLRPGARRADAQDMFLIGKVAIVGAVMGDVDGRSYLAVTLADDPGADLQLLQRRFYYFEADEVELVESNA